MPFSGLPDGRLPVLLTAHDADLLPDAARDVLDYLGREAGQVAQIAAHLLGTRRVRRHRTVLRARDTAELADGLRAVVDGRDHPLVARSARSTTSRRAFVFPGQGTQWPGMGAEAYRGLRVYRDTADRIDAAFRSAGLTSPLRFLTAPAASESVSHLELQGAQFIHAVALAAVWRSCGILPDLTIGHSLGEVAAAHVAECLSLDDAITVLAARAGAIEAIPGDHGVAVLGMDAVEAAELIARAPGWLELSAINASASVAVSGERRAVTALVEAVAGTGRFARPLAMSFPAHTSAMDACGRGVTDALPVGEFTDSAVQFIGSATGDIVAAGTGLRSYWLANLRNTIRFDRAVDTGIAHHADAFLEMSGHPSLLFAVEDGLDRSVPPRQALVLGSGHRDQPIADSLAANIAAAAVADPGFRWADLLAARPHRLRRFPGAPMRAEHLWAASTSPPAQPTLTVTGERWEPFALHDRGSATPRSVAVLGAGPDHHPDPAWAEAIRRHRAAVPTAASEAEVLVVLAPSFPDVDAAASVGALSAALDRGLLDYADAIGPRCRDVWLVTDGAEQINPDDAAPHLASAALAAMHRSVAHEHPDQSFHHLDLASSRRAAAAAEILDVLLGATGEIAMRDGVCYRRTLDREASPAHRFDAEVLDDVVITGGHGTIGSAYARALTALGARRITLLSRRGEVDDIAGGHGTEIVSRACDITDPAAVAAAARTAGKATLVVHAAGTAAFAERTAITGTALTEMTAARLAGLDHLTATWPMTADTRILLCSSVTAVWGGRGVAAYAAANRMLDAAAARLRIAGRRAVAIRWGLWEGSTIVDTTETARVQRTGLRPLTPADAVAASLADHPIDPLIFAADPRRLQSFLAAAEKEPPPPVADGPVTASEAVRSQLALVLDVDAATLDLGASLFDLGVDSLLALDLRRRLTRTTGHTVALASLLGGITGTDLIAALRRESESPA
ncbi:polyketide synthase [Mycolicibacterium chubuense]|uniref:Erythronolide synthase, modules 5 and 6 n=1 Tax=Mycolicibacterium chubuense TaxID=1800 RepID=A0A0J6W731_MYCCU|nr:mycobactin polyketide synthase MbtD [Mycolicibacterium chubuense]KMO77643.1 Erythronolide synthase, modules 5 and 6 [Mycolicibacterium chubuense]ORA54300.1 polyketide synthase [Mycolicibacterium chubuense]SPX96726.1 acyl transferase domain-containing protein [Mycolicibacterium chubuense]